jgi:hypothetical protein
MRKRKIGTGHAIVIRQNKSVNSKTIKVVAAKALALKENKKRKTPKNKQTTEALEKCKDHGGPVTEKDIEKIEKLNEKELKQEISYLRLTVAPNIRQRSKEEGNFSVGKQRILI